MYAGRQKTVTRDLNKIVVATGLVRRNRWGFVAAREIMFGFTPRVRDQLRRNVLVDFSDVETDLG